MRLPSAPLSLLALSFALPLLACGGDPGPGGDLGGSWRELPYASDDTPDPIDQRTVWTFNDDGTYERGAAGATPEVGRYEVDGADVTIIQQDDAGTEHRYTVTYYASDDRLLLGVLEPDGGADGVVGSWRGHVDNDGTGLDVHLDVAADHTGHIEYVTADQTTVYDGTWTQTGDELVLTFEVDDNGSTFTLTTHAVLIDGLLGGPALERL